MLAVFQVIWGNHDLLYDDLLYDDLPYDDLPYDLDQPEHMTAPLPLPKKW